MTNYQPKIHSEGPDEQVIESGGTQSVKSGGVVNFEAGSEIQFGGSDQRAALAAAVATPVAGVAAGYKIARGKTTPTAASETVATGLATVVAVVASLSAAPTLTHMFVSADVGDQAGSPAAGSFTLTSKKPTSANDVTPIDATTPWGEVEWIAVGT